MEFDYFYVKTVAATIDIENIGNCAIKAFNDDYESYLLVIRTSAGFSRIFTYGPINVDLDMLGKTCNCSFKRMEFKDGKIRKEIESFLNNPYYRITQAMEVSYEEALDSCKSIIDYMREEDAF